MYDAKEEAKRIVLFTCNTFDKQKFLGMDQLNDYHIKEMHLAGKLS